MFYYHLKDVVFNYNTSRQMSATGNVVLHNKALCFTYCL